MDPMDIDHVEVPMDMEIDNTDEAVPMDEIDFEQGWTYHHDGRLCYHYEVNGIPCIMWEYDEGFFPWQYGDNMYKVHDIYAFDDNDHYIGYMTEDGDLHVYQPEPIG